MKWFCAAAAVATALSLYPFLAGESIEFRWWWYGFEAVAEQETEILPEQLEEIGRRMKEAHPQSTMAKPIPCAFLYNGKHISSARNWGFCSCQAGKRTRRRRCG